MAAVHEAIYISSSPTISPLRPTTTKEPDSYSNRMRIFDADDFDFDCLTDDLATSKRRENSPESARNGGRTRYTASILQERHNFNARAIPSLSNVATKTDGSGFDDRFSDDIENTHLLPQPPAKRRKVTSESFAVPNNACTGIHDLTSDIDIETPLLIQQVAIDSQVGTRDPGEDDDDDLPDLCTLTQQPASQAVHKISVATIGNGFTLSSDGDLLARDPVLSSSGRPGRIRPSRPSNTAKYVLSSPEARPSRSLKSVSTSAGSTLSGLGFKQSKGKALRRDMNEDLDKIIDSSQTGPLEPPSRTQAAAKRPTKPSNTAAEKEAGKHQKRLDKEAKRAEKQREKDQKQAEKQLASNMADVNKRKTDRKVTAREMIVEMPASLRDKVMGNQVTAGIEQVGARVSFYDEEIDLIHGGGGLQKVGKVIKWQREMKSTYDEAEEEWRPLASARMERENHVLVYITAEEFCEIATADAGRLSSDVGRKPSEDEMKANLDKYIALLRSQQPNSPIILLIEGLTSYIKKIANSRNRQYQKAVRQQAVSEDLQFLDPVSAPPSSSAPSRKRKATQPSIDLSFLSSDTIEELEVHLQLAHQPLQIHHTTSTAASAKQIDAFTQHLSTRPYRHAELNHNLDHASFCMASGQVRTGQGDNVETWIKMIEQVNRLTNSIAYGVVNAGYKNPTQLVRGFIQAERSAAVAGARTLDGTDAERQGRERAKLMLQDVKRAANKLGADSEKRLGPMISKRLYKVFMSMDEGMRDGIA